MSTNLRVYVDPLIEESLPDNLTSEYIQIEAGPSRYLKPGRQTTVKLTVNNSSSVGRMAHISATYEGDKLSVTIPINNIYIAPQGSTAIYAIVRTYAATGSHDIVFSAI